MPTLTTPRSRRSRAAALPPDARRAAIARATLELLAERGPAITTRQIAEAAGIAEGTIFHVFADKEAVLQAAVDLAVDPGPVEAELAAIDRGLPLEDRLGAAVTVVQARSARVWRVLTMVDHVVSVPRKPADLPGLVALFEPDASRLRCSPAQAARQLRALTVAMSHPDLGPDEPAPAAEIVSLLLDGVRARGDEAGL